MYPSSLPPGICFHRLIERVLVFQMPETERNIQVEYMQIDFDGENQ